MEFSCPLEDDYIFELSNFAFLQKIDYEHDYYTRARHFCEKINAENQEEGDVEEIEEEFLESENEKKNMTEYLEAIQNPDMIPVESEYNRDLNCSFETMFKSVEAQ